MKKADILPAILAGNKIAVGEFRDWEVQEFPNKKTTGGPSTIIETSFVLVGREVLHVGTFAPRGAKLTDCKRPAFKVGDKVVAMFTSLESTKYGVRVNGTIEPLTD